MAAVQHMVLVQFKPDVSDELISGIYRQLAELQTLIPGITGFSGGPYASPEGLNGEYTHGFLVTFESPAARDIYLPHPEHERVKAAILPHVVAVVAFDYEVRDWS